jgi:hypothetical protein
MFLARADAALHPNGMRHTVEVLERARIAPGAFIYAAITRDKWVQRYRQGAPPE